MNPKQILRVVKRTYNEIVSNVTQIWDGKGETAPRENILNQCSEPQSKAMCRSQIRYETGAFDICRNCKYREI